MKKLIVGNWKMNPASPRDAESLARDVSKSAAKAKNNVDVVICPPFPFLNLKSGFPNLTFGSQDIFWEEKGAFTGEVSAAMLKGAGVEYAIIGHSERRKWLGETDEMVNKKVLAAAKAGIKVILCVGEPASVRVKGISEAKKFVKKQLAADLKGVRMPLAVAYEPVWAIGTGKADLPAEAAKMAEFIRAWCAARGAKAKVLYGGSVTGANAARFIQYKGIDGVLVGGASLKSAEFSEIINIFSLKK